MNCCRQLLLLLCLYIALPRAHAQTPQLVQGTVRDDKGEIVIGATVCEKGLTSNSTMTDTKGHFSITLKGASHQVFISFVGYERLTLTATDAPVNVKLKQTNSNINEVVVMGYQQVQRRNMTAAVSTIKGSDIANTPEASFTQMLQGRLAGVSVQSQTGEPGTRPNIIIRGSTNVDYGNSNGGNAGPLYIIDGVIFDVNSMSSSYGSTDPTSIINPNDIESIDILKDAAAAAVYGARAGNGVILIKTKRPHPGKPQVGGSAYFGVTQRPNLREIYTGMAERNLKLDLLSQLDWNSTQQGLPIQLTDSLNSAFNNDVDWQKMLIRSSALVNNEDVHMGGYMGNSSYYLSLGHYNEQGMLKGYGIDKLTPHFTLTVQPLRKMSITTNVLASFEKHTHGANGNLFLNSWTMPTSLTYLNPTQYATFNGQSNPYDDDKVTSFTGNVTLLDTITNGLTFTSQFTGSNYIDRWDYFSPAAVNGTLNTARDIAANNPSWSFENYLNYYKKIKDHTFTALLGTSAMSNMNYYTYASGAGITTTGVNTIQGVPSGPNLSASTSTQRKTTVSLYGNLSYQYKGRYLLSATMRRDASSIYSSNYRWGTFPSISAGWIVSDEGFFAGAGNVINFLKLRASYGLTGLDPSGNYYAKYQALNADASYYGGTTSTLVANGTAGGTLGGLPVTYNNKSVSAPFNYNNSYYANGTNSSANARWEKYKSINLGADLEFFNSRIALKGDVYQKDAIDKFFYGIPTQSTAGYLYYSGNYVNVRNRGLELELHTHNFPQKAAFQWNTDFLFSLNRNLVTKLPNNNRDFIFGDPWFQRKLTLGKPLFDYSVWKTNGVYATDAEIPVDPLTGKRITYFDNPFQVGDARIVDQNGDYNINYDDKVSGGNPNPKFIGGFRNTFAYKGFSLDLFFSYSYGNTISNGFLSDALNGSLFYNASWGAVSGPAALAGYLDQFWTKPGDQTKFPRMIYSTATGTTQDPWNIGRSYFLEDGSFVKLKTATLGYRLPESWVKSMHLRTFSIFLMGENLLLLKKSDVPDPELYDPTTGSANVVYPTSKKFTLGINLQL